MGMSFLGSRPTGCLPLEIHRRVCRRDPVLRPQENGILVVRAYSPVSEAVCLEVVKMSILFTHLDIRDVCSCPFGSPTASGLFDD